MRASHFVLPILFATSALAAPNSSFGQVVIGVSITIAPPALPVYEQPAIPTEGYIWTPGYWAYGSEGYYWVPGTWVQPPSVGLLWTPGYWGWLGGVYVFNAGYWAPHVGFYGGINYGFGYNGSGYDGGRWNNGAFAYNRAVNNIGSAHTTNVYNSTVVNNTTVNNVSYNGGTGGLAARPTAQEETVAHEQHIAPTSQQVAHVQAAQSDHSLLASVNHGVPTVAATPKPAELHGPGVVQAKGTEPLPAAAHTPAAAAAVAGRPPLGSGVTSHAAGTAVGAVVQPRPVAPPLTRAAGTQPLATTQHPQVVARPAETANAPAKYVPNAAAPHPQAAARPAATPTTNMAHAPATVAQHPQVAPRPTETAQPVTPHPEVAAHAPAAVSAPRPAVAPAHPAPEKRPEQG